MAFQAFLIALIIFVGKADYFVGTAMLGRPLVLGMLVGIALGDVSQGGDHRLPAGARLYGHAGYRRIHSA